MGRWSYAAHGHRRRPGDPDVLLLHGLFIDSALWRAQIDPLARLARVVALDLPGHGRSEVPPPFDVPGQARLLAVAIEQPDVLARLGQVAAPTLVLHGRKDRGYPPAVGERLARAIPGARLEWIEEAGHTCVLERPDEVNRLLVPFVERQLR